VIDDKNGFSCFEQPVVEHARVRRGFEHVVFEDVPAGEDQVVEAGERHEFLDLRGPPVSPLAEAHRAHLRERADGLGQAFADSLDAGDERRSDSAHARNHHAQLALGWLHGAFGAAGRRPFGATYTAGQLHLAAGPLGMGQGGLAMLVFAR